jgi:hypothetical protein
VLVWGAERCARTGEQLLTVKVTDYGTLRTAGSSSEDLTLGRGTQAFMAPEVEEQAGGGSSGP